jgi:hypothetical protein
MLLKFFLMYMGATFACSVALFVLVKKFSVPFASQGQKPVWYTALSALLASGASYAATLITDNLFTVYWILTGVFLVFGAIHLSITQKKYFKARADNKREVLIGELFFAISVILFTIVVFSGLQYFLKDKNFLFFPMMTSVLGFFVPTLLVHTFNAAYSIPQPLFQSWQYPISQPIDLPDDNPNEKLLVIGFEIAKKLSDTRKTYFRAKAPEGIKLGELYYHFINDYNELHSETPIAFMNDFSEAYYWLFCTKAKWYQRSRVLNPNVTIRENKIKENTVIVCDRLPETATA